MVIKVGEQRLKPWDPFGKDHSATQELPSERLNLRGHTITVRPYVLPHESKLSTAQAHLLAGPDGWNAQQGFYLYRRNRLVAAGEWLGMGLTRGDTYSLARIALEVPAELDRDFQLDVSKSGVVVPRTLHAGLRRIAEVTRKRASAVRSHRAVPVKRAVDRQRTTVWTSSSRRGVQGVRLNRRHPVITELIGQTPDPELIRTALDLIEETVPSQLLASIDEQARPLDSESSDALSDLAERVYNSFLQEGKSRSEAAQRVMHTEPFYLYPDISDFYGEIIAKP